MRIAPLVIIALTPFIFAQTKSANTIPLSPPTIYMGTDLRLGMLRDTVISRVTTSYQLVRIQDGGDTWMVEEKNNPLTKIGALGFTDGKLTYVAKDWIQGDEDGFAFAQALRGAMAAMQSEGHYSCSFETPSSRSPKAEISYLRFYCGPKRIEIMTTDVLNGEAKGRFVSVTEVLSSEKYR